MSGLINNLISASKALGAHQAGVQVASRNLANVTNPNYARQRVVLGDRAVVESPSGPVSSGLEALGIKQFRDRLLDNGVNREKSITSLLLSQQSALNRAQAALGEQVDRSGDSSFPGSSSQSSNGLSTALNDFFNSFENLSANPTDPAARQLLLQKADTLANKFNLADTRLSTLQSDLDTQISTGTTSVNSLLQQIADLNASIVASEVGNQGSAIDLRDQRQARLEDLATYMDFSSVEPAGANGQIQIYAKDPSGANVLLLDKTSVKGALTFNGTQFSAGSPASNLSVTGGSLAGQLLSRDGPVQELRDNLKTAADQVTAAVNAAYGGTFFQAPPATGLMALDPTLSVANLKTGTSTDPGANDIALAIASLSQRNFSTGTGDLLDGTVGGFYNQTVTALGQSISGIDSKLTDQENIEKIVTTQRNGLSSVSMDEEMADLIKFQRAYQASARVLRVMDEMLDGLVNGLIS
jgi:flagellar hook-associated protein 1